MNTYSIYTLACPETNQIRYVGRTCDSLKTRLNNHLSRPTNNNTANWIHGLKAKGLRPIIEELELVTEKESVLVESFWISQFKTWGFQLFNMNLNSISRKRSDFIKPTKIYNKNELRIRLIGAQSQLPSRINFDLYEFYFGKLKASEKRRVQNVWLFKATDEKITKNFETLAKKTKANS